MAKSVKKNFIYNILFQIVSLLIPLITTPYVSRVLGSENIGMFSFKAAIVGYFVIVATFGSTVYGQRLIGSKQDNKEELSNAFWDIFWFRLLSGSIFYAIYFGYLLLFSEVNLLGIVVSIDIINVIFDISWFFQGNEDFKRTILRNLIVKIVCLICIFVFVKTREQTWLYALFSTGSFLLGNLFLWIPLRKRIRRPTSFKPFKHLKGMFLIFIPAIASQVYTILDKSMIGWITGSDYFNGCYEQSEKLIRAAITVVTAVGAVTLPRVALLYENGKQEEAREYVYQAYRIVWALGLPIMIGAIFISNILIPIYLGDEFELSILLLQIFSPLVIFVSLGYVTGLSYLIASKQQNVYTVSTIAAAVVNFALNMVLIRFYGAIGAAISSITAEFVGAAIQICYCLIKKQLHANRIFVSAIKYLIAAAIMGGTIFGLKFVLPSNIIGLVALIGIGVVVYFATLLIERDSLVLSTLKRIKKMVFKKD